MKLLLIEDDRTLAKNLKQVLEKKSFAVDLAYSKEEGHTAIQINEYDCVILDIGLPDGTGFALLKNLRELLDKTPVIIVTARGQVEDKVHGLNMGADDYIGKPVDSAELIARIHAVTRRNQALSLPTITLGALTVKPAEHMASINNTVLDLTSKEFAVLVYLAEHSGQAVTRTMLMEHVWGSEFETFSNVIDVYIRNLRRKIEKHTTARFITTIRGKGYVLRK